MFVFVILYLSVGSGKFELNRRAAKNVQIAARHKPLVDGTSTKSIQPCPMNILYIVVCAYTISRGGPMWKLLKKRGFRRVRDATPYKHTIYSYVHICKTPSVGADPCVRPGAFNF